MGGFHRRTSDFRTKTQAGRAQYRGVDKSLEFRLKSKPFGHGFDGFRRNFQEKSVRFRTICVIRVQVSDFSYQATQVFCLSFVKKSGMILSGKYHPPSDV